jgi:hypothetical protein
MTEEELIKRFRTILTIIPNKESRIRYADDPSQLLTELNQLKQEKESITAQLKSIEDKSLTTKKTENVRIMLNELFKMIIHAYILIKIAEDISYSLDYNFIVASDYYLEIGSEFNCDEIVRILRESINYLNNSKINDYVELFEFTRSVQKQIVRLDKDCGRINFN